MWNIIHLIKNLNSFYNPTNLLLSNLYVFQFEKSFENRNAYGFLWIRPTKTYDKFPWKLFVSIFQIAMLHENKDFVMVSCLSLIKLRICVPLCYTQCVYSNDALYVCVCVGPNCDFIPFVRSFIYYALQLALNVRVCVCALMYLRIYVWVRIFICVFVSETSFILSFLQKKIAD